MECIEEEKRAVTPAIKLSTVSQQAESDFRMHAGQSSTVVPTCANAGMEIRKKRTITISNLYILYPSKTILHPREV
jgi:hypothetical protein